MTSTTLTLFDIDDLETYLYDDADYGTAFITDSMGTKWIAGLNGDDASFAVRLPYEDENGKPEKRREFVTLGIDLCYPVTALTA